MAVRDGGSARKPGAGLIMESDVEPGQPAAGSPTRRGRQMRRSPWWAHADHPAMALSAGQRMMSAVLTGGNAGTGTSAVNPIGRLTPAGPHLVHLASGRTPSRRRVTTTQRCAACAALGDEYA